jgi:hypothetical protein
MARSQEKRGKPKPARRWVRGVTTVSTFPPAGLFGKPPAAPREAEGAPMIRKLPDGRYRLYSRKKDPRTGRRRNLGTFATRAEAERHERAVQFFKRR